MTQLFLNQAVQLKFETGTSLAAATVIKVLYQDPDGTPGEWTGSSVDGTKLVRDMVPGDVTVPGIWRMQAYAEIGGLPYYGAIVMQTFQQNLNPVIP